jgi:hypothetical protein
VFALNDPRNECSDVIDAAEGERKVGGGSGYLDASWAELELRDERSMGPPHLNPACRSAAVMRWD